MKELVNLIIGIFIISFMGCENNEPDNIQNVGVDTYIELLKAGTYTTSGLPNFTSEDIPALLEYRNETQMIQNFPVNGISSYWMAECSLGMYVLWTIESIRAVAIDSEYLIDKFPSQNPVVKQKNEPFDFVTGSAFQEIVAKSYNDWWEAHMDKEFNDFKHIDPLINSAYRWH